MEGFIFLHRKLLDSRLFKNEGLLKVWIWILLKANHSEKWFMFETGRGSSEICCNRGELIVGRKKAARELDMSPSRFYTLISKLKRLGKVSLQPTAHYTKIKVIKYADYQTLMRGDEQATDKQVTSNGQASDRQVTGYGHKQEHKNNKKVNNKKNNNKDEQAPKLKSLHSQLKEYFIKNYNEYTSDSYYWSAKDGANLKKLIQKISFTLKGKQLPDAEEDILSAFRLLIDNLPEWYKIEAFDISSVNSNYNKIINSLINGKQKKQSPSLQGGFSKIDELFN